MHHLHRAAGEAESHGPDGAAAGPVDEVVDLGDDVLDHLGKGGGGGRWRGAGVGGRGVRGRGEGRWGGV